MSKPPLTYDSKRLRAEFEALRASPRSPRVLDVLIEERVEVLGLIREGRNAKEVWQAFTRAGLGVSYSAFHRAMTDFLKIEGLPNGKPSRMSRFLAPRANAAAGAAAGVEVRTGAVGRGTGAGAGASAAPQSARERRAALAAPSAADLEQQRVAGISASPRKP